MALYIILSNLTDEGRKTIKSRPERIREVNKELEAMGGKVVAQYATLGPYDFVNVIEAANNEVIVRISVRARLARDAAIDDVAGDRRQRVHLANP